MLEEVIAKGKKLVVEENSDDEEEEVGEMTIHCVTCGSNIQVQTAIRHMERCYNKVRPWCLKCFFEVTGRSVIGAAT